MIYVFLTAFGIALCCLIGAVCGFVFENIPEKTDDSLMGLAAGIMLCAAICGLVLPSIDFSGSFSLWLPSLGIISGAVFLTALNRWSLRLSDKLGMIDDGSGSSQRALIFVAAIAIHHLPEGMAAGVSFGTGDLSDALTVCSGIAFQNIPESMIIIPPMLKSGAGKKNAVIASLISGGVELVGVFLGYFAISISKAALPFLLAFAAGTMLYVIIDDMVPETHSRGNGRIATYSALLGFCLMLIINGLV